MSKVQIDIPEEFYKKLKVQATEHCQSLRKYILYNLIQLADNKLKYIAEGSVITTKTTATTSSLTPEEIEEQQKQSFLSLCEDMYGKKFYNEYKPDIIRSYLSLDPSMEPYYSAAAEPPEGKYIKAVYTMPQDLQEQYITEMKHYLEEE